MLTLAAGSRKYLVSCPATFQRNAERAKPGDPSAVVVEVHEDGTFTRHVCFSARALGPVDFDYVQQGYAVKDGRHAWRGAYVTTGEVRLATERGEDLENAE